jgi:HD-GYP domain-containing protein (c-di-GMP phosphodiesterase class II)
MYSHPATGAGILKPIKLYPDVVTAVLNHHENYDGSGYPQGLAGEEIHPLGRVIRITDSFDAMTSSRAYRGGHAVNSAVEEIIANAGTVYDPEGVEAFVRIVDTPGTVRELGMASLQIDLGDAG